MPATLVSRREFLSAAAKAAVALAAGLAGLGLDAAGPSLATPAALATDGPVGHDRGGAPWLRGSPGACSGWPSGRGRAA